MTSIAGSWAQVLAGEPTPVVRYKPLTDKDQVVLLALKDRGWVKPVRIQIILRVRDKMQMESDPLMWILLKLCVRGLVERRHMESERNFEYRLKSIR